MNSNFARRSLGEATRERMLLVDGFAYSLKLTESVLAQLTSATTVHFDRNTLSTPTKSYALKSHPTSSQLIQQDSYTPIQQSLSVKATKSTTGNKKREYRYSTTEDDDSDDEALSSVVRNILHAEWEANVEPYTTINATLRDELANIERGGEATLSLKEIRFLVERLGKLRAKLDEIAGDLRKFSLS